MYILNYSLKNLPNNFIKTYEKLIILLQGRPVNFKPYYAQNDLLETIVRRYLKIYKNNYVGFYSKKFYIKSVAFFKLAFS